METSQQKGEAFSPRSPLMASLWSDSEERARIGRYSLALWRARKDDVFALDRLLTEDPELILASGYDGRTPLHVAAFHNCTRVAHLLLERGAPVDALDRWGNSPLADAESAGHLEMARMLKKYGGHLSGNHGKQIDQRIIAPPSPQLCDWEIDPAEIDFSQRVLIGKGSFAEIHKASWRGTPVAVKTILPILSDNETTRKDFRHEVDLLVKMRHPNIVQFLGAVTRSKDLMLVTEYLEGGDLHMFLKGRGSLPMSVAINFALDIARGMAYLHSGNNVLIHRDLKPHNVLLVDANHLKVADFGLSTLITVEHLRKEYKLTGGTGCYHYMAPEVFEHKPYDEHVDVFSFAMIMYEMFEGTPPFMCEEPHQAAKLVASGTRPEFRAKNYPPSMKELIQRCWDSNGASRPSFMKILEELEGIKSGII